MRASLDLDDRSDAVLLDARHDPGESIARGLRDDGSLVALAFARSLEATHLGERDEPLTAW